MERRRGEREREIESDTRDRQKEREELDDLKNKIFAEGHSDPSATFKQVNLMDNNIFDLIYNILLLQALYDREQQYKPKLIVAAPPVEEPIAPYPQAPPSPLNAPVPPQPTEMEELPLSKETNSTTPVSSAPSTPMTIEANNSSADGSIVPMEEDTMGSTVSTSTSSSPIPLESDGKQGSQGPSLVFAKRKKLEIRTAFNADEDDAAAPRKRKLVPLGNVDEEFITDFRLLIFLVVV